MAKKYEGRRLETGCIVTVDGKPLRPRRDLQNHSPTGFEWGYEGSGPAQLAVAILADFLGDDDEAVRLHQKFKRKALAFLPSDTWSMSEEYVRDTVAMIRAEEAEKNSSKSA